ncbi:MAG: lysophospholipid acyltransferase family protein, partial [Candidatus Fermentibacteria bacterium]
GVRRKIVMMNLRQAFPDKSRRELDKTGLQSYMNSGRFMLEFARQDRMGEDYIAKHITVRDPEVLDVLKDLNGAIIITGHFGNWELFGVACRYKLKDVAFLVGRQSNSLVDAYINGMRSTHGIELYNRRSAVRGVLKSMKRGGYVCWLSDQDAGSSGVVIDFFGYPASTPRGAAAFSVKLGVPVVPAVLLREGKGADHQLVIGKPVYPDSDLSPEEAEKEVTQEYTMQLEKIIIRNPELYWWAHRRWKTTGLYTDRKHEASVINPEGKDNEE